MGDAYFGMLNPKTQPMKTRIVLFFCLLVMLASCARGVTPFEAANKSYKKCRGLR